jgi:hypothetical protein
MLRGNVEIAAATLPRAHSPVPPERADAQHNLPGVDLSSQLGVRVPRLHRSARYDGDLLGRLLADRLTTLRRKHRLSMS